MDGFKNYVAENVAAADGADQSVAHISTALGKKLKAAFRRYQIVPTSQRDIVVEHALEDYFEVGLDAYYRGRQDPFVKRIRMKLKALAEGQR